MADDTPNHVENLTRLLERLIEERRDVAGRMETTSFEDLGRQIEELNRLIDAVEIAKEYEKGKGSLAGYIGR